MSLVAATGLRKDYRQGGDVVAALRDVALAVEEGEFLCVTGPSGSGKSTLLSLLAGLDRPTRGSVTFRGEALETASSGRLAELRRTGMGFVFQDFRLVRHLTARANVRLPLLFAGDGEDRADELLERVGLAARAGHRPHELSRGEMQRVAVARALVHDPAVVFADEPTASLDRANREAVWRLLSELHTERGLTLVVAAHDAEQVPGAARTVRLADGRMVEPLRRGTDG